MTERLCAKCHFPIHRDDTVRHYGFYEAHLESRCLELLRAEVTRLREENAGVRERNDRVVAIEGSGIPWRDVDDNYDYAASAVRAKIARADAEHAAALAAERERVIEEAAQVADDYDVDMDINVDPCSAIAYKIRALAALSAAQPPEAP